MLALYTDGVTEARNPNRHWFGTERLDESVRQGRGTADAAVSEIMRSVKAFEDGFAPADDQTVIVARFQ